MAQSVEHPTLDFSSGYDRRSWNQAPHQAPSSSWRFSPSLFLCTSSPLMLAGLLSLSLSLSVSNKINFFQNDREFFSVILSQEVDLPIYRMLVKDLKNTKCQFS